ncbi:MAG: GyrI-like domain-containing protein [Nocardioidaceae bacterium]
MAQFTVEEIPATVVVTIRRKVPLAELTEFFGSAFGQVMAAVSQAGGSPGGPPFGWYHGVPTDTADVSAGFPVVGDVHTPDGGVRVQERPGGRCVVGLHVGSYDTLDDTYRDLDVFLTAHGLTPAEEMWEEYLSPPEGDPSRWETRVVQPLA